jgi:hypothetical protein
MREREMSALRAALKETTKTDRDREGGKKAWLHIGFLPLPLSKCLEEEGGQAQDAKRTQEKELYCFVVLFRERKRDKNQRETGGRAIKK